MSKFSAVREIRRRGQRTKLVSLPGAAIITLIITLTVSAALAAVDGSYIQAAVLAVGLVLVLSLFRVTTKDDSYDRYLSSLSVLSEMSDMVVELESGDIPLDSKHGEDFYTHFSLANRRSTKPGRLTRDDMDYVALHTALAHTALEDHAAVQSVEGSDD